MKRRNVCLVWCGMVAAALAQPGAALERRAPPVSIAAPAWSPPPPSSSSRPSSTVKADYLVGHQWILAGGQVSRRERMALLLLIDVDTVQVAVLPEDPGAPMAGPVMTFTLDTVRQEGPLVTLRGTRQRQHGGTHTLQLSRQGSTVTIHEVWRDRFGHETRSAIRVATFITRLGVDDGVDGLDGLARRLDAERRLGG